MFVEEATICNIQRFSSEDGPGVRTTVFFKGCPMRCPWCHNPEAMQGAPELVWHAGRCLRDFDCVEKCPKGALAVDRTRTPAAEGANGETIRVVRLLCDGCAICADNCPASALELLGRRQSVKDVFEMMIRDAAFYDTSGGGVTLSGGEPLSQPRAAIELLAALKCANVSTALDTCGAGPLWALEEALAHTDLVLFDVKTVDEALHEEWTGIPFAHVAEAARAIDRAGVPVWVRSPIVPGYTATEGSVRGVARFVAETFAHCARHDLLAFSNLCAAKYAQLDRPFALEGAPLLTAADMDRFCAVARAAGSKTARWSGPCAVAEASS